MSRQEAMEALIESGMELRRDDIQLGKKLERERIIKLLEGFDDSCLWRQVKWSPDAYEGFNMQELIDLIKGEQK